MKKWIPLLTVGLLSGVISAVVTLAVTKPAKDIVSSDAPYDQNVRSTSMPVYKGANVTLHDDFVEASSKTLSSVVFIQTTSEYEYRSGSFLDWFFEPRTAERTSSGSGVILTKDGYIVTNNHVVENANLIRVISGKKSYEAELVGVDPSTDLAVIKIEASNLPAIQIGNSDNVSVGEWVLAVGNPFNLTSTVTAGIVSAKGRNLNILRDKFPIESFIQTDAAINPGNSGGALVNSNGELIGINTAILSRTGSYAGYGFAVPVNIVKKVFDDIKSYGEVQKAFLGAEYVDVDQELSERFDLDDLNGVIVAEVQPNGAAAKAGLQKGDVIRKISTLEVENRATIEEVIGNKYPGEQVELQILRDGKVITRKVTLTNSQGGTGIVRREVYESQLLKASFETATQVERDFYSIRSGVKVVDVERNGFFYQLEIPEGFIITQINNEPIESPKEIEKILNDASGYVRIYGIDKNGRKVYYPFRF